MTRLFRNAEIRKYLQMYLNVLMTEGLEQNFEFRMAALLRYFLNKGILVDMKSRERGVTFSSHLKRPYIRFFCLADFTADFYAIHWLMSHSYSLEFHVMYCM